MTWETPIDIFNELNREFNFTLDPCCLRETELCIPSSTPSVKWAVDWKQPCHHHEPIFLPLHLFGGCKLQTDQHETVHFFSRVFECNELFFLFLRIHLLGLCYIQKHLGKFVPHIGYLEIYTWEITMQSAVLSNDQRIIFLSPQHAGDSNKKK